MKKRYNFKKKNFSSGIGKTQVSETSPFCYTSVGYM